MAGFQGPHDDVRAQHSENRERAKANLDRIQCQTWIVVVVVVVFFSFPPPPSPPIPNAGLPERPGLGSIIQPRVAQLLDVRLRIPAAAAADVLASSFLL
ncbi:hypothetical protein CP532_5284 [Ophiocordyceps camponoti-leonardi (nom. inval.)]|nr:hypothetical protein CP532_5284 [Ophiocordyceps camponoti-leonardi (nom. inval.)]